MNKLTIIGNLTNNPELRSTATGLQVCTFTVAVNRRGKEEQADFFRVTAWRELANNCASFLVKGKKVCVVGPVSVQTYTGKDGKTRASLELQANEVEFLTPKGNVESVQDHPNDYIPITNEEADLPF